MFSLLRCLGRGTGLSLVLVGCLAGAFGVGRAQGQGAWPTFRQNAQRTGASTLPGPGTPEVRWRYDLGGYAYSSPAVGPGGIVFVGSADSVYAVNPDGARRWAQAVPVQDYVISSPAVATDGTVFVGSRDRNLYVIWEEAARPRVEAVPLGDEVWASPLLPAGRSNRAYVGAFDGYLYRLDGARSGQTPVPERFYATLTAPLGGEEAAEIIASPALGRDGTIYLGSTDGRLYAVRPDGQDRWAPFQTGGEIVATPAVAGSAGGADAAVIVASRDSSVYAVDPATGGLRWTTRIGRDLIASPAVAGAVVYVATYDEDGAVGGELVALDAATGFVRWTRALDGPVVSSPAVDAGGRIYVGTLNGTLYAIEADGTVVWQMTLDGPVWASPSIGPGEVLYVVTSGTAQRTGTLYAIGSAPFVVRTDPPEGEAGRPVAVTADPAEAPTAATLFVRPGGGHDFVPIDMTPTGAGAQVQAAIPESMVTLRGLEYYIQLVFDERVETYPSDQPQSHPATLRVRVPQADPGGAFLPRRYRMVSIPLELDDPALSAVFAGYGPYQPDQWRLLRWNGQEYVEGPALNPPATPGRAYFLITQWGTPFRTGSGVSVNTAGPYLLTLRPGWNQIGNPFPFPVAWSAVGRDPAAVSPGDIAVFRDGVVQTPAMLDTLRLMPWEGYFVFNRSGASTTLRIPADEAVAEPEVVPARTAASPVLVAVQAEVPGTGARDVYNWVGFADADRAARYTMAEAPPLYASLRLSVWEDDRPHASVLKPMTREGARWMLRLRHDRPRTQEVRLTIRPEGRLPEGFDVYLVDPARNHHVLLDGGQAVVTVPPGEGQVLELLLGTPAYLARSYPALTEAPAAFALGAAYPDPFRTATTIPYTLRTPGPVRLDVFNLLGQRVATLVDAVQEAGRHAVRWDGRDEQGRVVAGGLYVCRLTAGEAVATRTLLRVR